MGVNHDQFSHFPRLRSGSSALILQMVVILAKIVFLVACGLQISLSPRGECKQAVRAVEFWRYRGDQMGVNHDQFSHFSPFRPGSSTVMLQTVVLLAETVFLVASGLQISLSPRGECRQAVRALEF